MDTILIKGKSAFVGVAEGEALVSKQPISFLGGVDPDTGIVIERGHELEGENITGKVLIFPGGKGSTSGSYIIYALAKKGIAPQAMINLVAEPIIVTGAVISKIPLMDKLEQNPLDVIQNGDWVRVDGEKGIVEVTKKPDSNSGFVQSD